MSEVEKMARRNFYKGKYELTKEEFLSAKYYAARYQKWLDEYNALKDSVGAIVSDDMPHAINNISDPTGRLAERRAELKDKMEVIERTAFETDPQIAKWLLIMAVTPEMTFEQLKAKHDIPCGSSMFYERRRKFYWLLSQKI